MDSTTDKIDNGIIYLIRNKINNSFYVGLDSKGRYGFGKNSKTKYKGSGKKLNNAYSKYGFDSFEKYILVDGIKSFEELNKLEIEWIDFLGTYKRKGCYNLTEGGGGSLGYKMPNKSIIKQLETKRNRPIFEKENQFNKQKQTIANRTPEEREIIANKLDETLANRTPEEIKQKSDRIKKSLNGKSDEWKRNKEIKRKETLANRTDEEKAIHSKNISDSRRNRSTEDLENKRKSSLIRWLRYMVLLLLMV